jgi:predicted transcriptional regulator
MKGNLNLIKIFNNLAQETRFSVFKLLVKANDDGMKPSDLLKKIKISNGTLSFHLKELENSGLITSEREGRNITYRINPDSLGKITSFLIDECNFLIENSEK